MGIKEIYHSKFRWLGVALMILPLLSSCIREEAVSYTHLTLPTNSLV